MDKIIYLSSKLKAFTFDDIYLLAEMEAGILQNMLDNLVKTNCLKKDSQGYVFVTPQMIKAEQKEKVLSNKSYGIFVPKITGNKNTSFNVVTEHFLNNYAVKFCTKSTARTYFGMFRNHILPYFSHKFINKITVDDIIGFFIYCQDKNMSNKRLKNIMALLRQLLHYARNNGFTNKICEFQVKRLNAKNEFDSNRILFAQGVQICFYKDEKIRSNAKCEKKE